jgi:uncharacterized phiE125 gp8 family phage protein
VESHSITINSEGAEFITLAEAKAHLVVDHSDDDLLISSQITAARKWAEHRTDRFFTPTTVTLARSRFDEAMELAHKPVQEIVSITYDDATEDNVLASTEYELDSYNNCVRLAYGKTYPSTRNHWNAVRIQYRVGYYSGSPEVVSVPEDVKRACLIVLGDLYANRERQQDMALYKNYTADMLIAHSRVWR